MEKYVLIERIIDTGDTVRIGQGTDFFKTTNCLPSGNGSSIIMGSKEAIELAKLIFNFFEAKHSK